MSNDELHVIFGSGQIGQRIARTLVGQGKRVRVVSRNPRPPQGAERAAGDARDPAFAAEAAAGATVVYDCMNPLYQDWKKDLLALGRGSLEAARASGAKLVALDCLYMYGAPDGPMSETTPMRPTSKKGQLRADLANLRLDSVVPVAIARGSDFFGPDLPTSWFGNRFFERALAGKTTECLGDPDQPHSYTYADDVADALLALGAASDATGVWHVPTVAAASSRELANAIGTALGRPVAIAQMSPLLLRLLGVAMPFMRELPEMRYQWEAPFVIDDSKFRARFGTEPTPLAQQIATTVAWAKNQLGKKAA